MTISAAFPAVLAVVASSLVSAAPPAESPPRRIQGEAGHYEETFTLPPADRASLESSIRQMLKHQSEAWSRGDLETFCASYADDAIFLSPTGVTQGRAAVLERYKKRYPDKAAMGTLTLEPLEIRIAPGDAASAISVAARWTLSYPDKPAASGLTLIVFHHVAAGWRIVQDASM